MQTLPDATPPIGKICALSKTDGTFEPIIQFVNPWDLECPILQLEAPFLTVLFWQNSTFVGGIGSPN